MNKITVFCPVKEDDDFINSYDAVQDAISKLSTAEKVAFSRGFLFRERNAVVITDEEIENEWTKWHGELDFEAGWKAAFSYIKSRINQ